MFEKLTIHVGDTPHLLNKRHVTKLFANVDTQSADWNTRAFQLKVYLVLRPGSKDSRIFAPGNKSPILCVPDCFLHPEKKATKLLMFS